MIILLTILGFASAHIVVVFIALVSVLSLIGIGVSETRSRSRRIKSSPATGRVLY